MDIVVLLERARFIILAAVNVDSGVEIVDEEFCASSMCRFTERCERLGVVVNNLMEE